LPILERDIASYEAEIERMNEFVARFSEVKKAIIHAFKENPQFLYFPKVPEGILDPFNPGDSLAMQQGKLQRKKIYLSTLLRERYRFIQDVDRGQVLAVFRKSIGLCLGKHTQNLHGIFDSNEISGKMKQSYGVEEPDDAPIAVSKDFEEVVFCYPKEIPAVLFSIPLRDFGVDMGNGASSSTSVHIEEVLEETPKKRHSGTFNP
jgi:hypothetical protein